MYTHCIHIAFASLTLIAQPTTHVPCLSALLDLPPLAAPLATFLATPTPVDATLMPSAFWEVHMVGFKASFSIANGILLSKSLLGLCWTAQWTWEQLFHVHTLYMYCICFADACRLTHNPHAVATGLVMPLTPPDTLAWWVQGTSAFWFLSCCLPHHQASFGTIQEHCAHHKQWWQPFCLLCPCDSDMYIHFKPHYQCTCNGNRLNALFWMPSSNGSMPWIGFLLIQHSAVHCLSLSVSTVYAVTTDFPIRKSQLDLQLNHLLTSIMSGHGCLITKSRSTLKIHIGSGSHNITDQGKCLSYKVVTEYVQQNKKWCLAEIKG